MRCRKKIRDYKTWGQVAGKGKTFVQDQGDAIVAVARSRDDLTRQAKRCKESATVSKFELDILFGCNGEVR